MNTIKRIASLRHFFGLGFASPLVDIKDFKMKQIVSSLIGVDMAYFSSDAKGYDCPQIGVEIGFLLFAVTFYVPAGMPVKVKMLFPEIAK